MSFILLTKMTLHEIRLFDLAEVTPPVGVRLAAVARANERIANENKAQDEEQVPYIAERLKTERLQAIGSVALDPTDLGSGEDNLPPAA